MSKESPGYLELDGAGLRVGVVWARFNQAITGALVEGARAGLTRHGVAEADIVEVSVPGAFELPLAAQALAASGRADAVVCLGAVIRGDTPHFEYVAGEAARGIQQVGLETGVPCIFGVLTTDTIEQAEERSGDDATNKGYEAALAAIDMAALLARIRADDARDDAGD